MIGSFAIIICAFLWSGFICAISFMESWLKFRAPGITMPVGLSIGKIVFSALNKVEWAFAIFIVSGMFFKNDKVGYQAEISFLLILVILIVQTAWLLPVLNKRAKAIISGKTLPPSVIHWYFVIAELVKLVLLFLFGLSLLYSIV